MERHSDWYSHPKYYEAIFGTDTEKELDFILAVNRHHGTGGALLLEPACGAGRLVEEAARRGLEIVGYDISEPMLAHARRRLSPARRRQVSLFQSRMESFSAPGLEGHVDLAFNLVSTFRYLDSEAAARAHLESTRRLLKPDGLYVLGFHLTDYARATVERERWVGHVGRDTVICNTREDLPDRSLRRSPMRNRLRITGPGKDMLIETKWFFRTYDLAEARRLFRSAGLRVLAMYDFDYRLEAPVGRGSKRLDRVFVLQPEPSAAGRKPQRVARTSRAPSK